MPALVVWVLRFQVGIVYVVAGLAKLNHDWLGHGEPMTTWLASRTGYAGHRDVARRTVVGLVASWLGAVFDLTIVGWLLWRRSRPFAYVALVVFHVLTWRLFAIGVFPWVMIAATTIFFAPDWPRRLPAPRPMGAFGRRKRPLNTHRAARSRSRRGRGAVVWATLQVAIPLRHVAYAGDVRWTEEGYYGSFRVMLTEKAGLLRFTVTDPATAETWTVDPTSVLTDWQARQAAIRPELAVAAAHLVADDFAGPRPRRRDRAGRLVGVVQRASASTDDRPAGRSGEPQPARPGVDVRAAARPGRSRLSGRAWVWLLPLVPLIGGRRGRRVAVAAATSEPAPVEITSSAADFATLEELVAASDLVVVATVADIAEGRQITAPADPAAAVVTRLAGARRVRRARRCERLAT